MKKLKAFTPVLAGTILLAISSCNENTNNAGVPEPDPFVIESEKLTFKVDTLFTELENPWGIAWLPDGRMLVTERKGEILVFENDQFSGINLEGVPEVHEVNQAGLMDIQLHPNYEENGWIYIA